MEITRENIKKINIKELALSPKFGSLTFEKSYKKLEKIQKWLTEFIELDYKNELPENVSTSIDNHIDQFINHLKWLEQFDIATISNAKAEHDAFEARIESFYNTIFNTLVVNHLDFLRQEVELKSKDKQKIQNEQKELQQLRKQSEGLVKQLTEEREKIQNETIRIESAKGERAAARFGKHFENQVKENREAAQKWLELRNKFFLAIFWVIIANLIIYFYLFIANKVNWWPYFPPKDFFTIEYGIVKFALLALLSYGVAFCSRNYNIQSNQATSNQHRKNVADTLTDFLNSNPQPEDRAELIKQGTETMFKHLPIGYIPKIESKDDGPIASIFNTILKQN